MKRVFLFTLVTLIAMASGCSSGPRTVKLDESSNGQTVELKTGELLQISLRSDPINGYAWQVEKSNHNTWKLHRICSTHRWGTIQWLAGRRC